MALEYTAGFIEDNSLAFDMAEAEAPGWDYLSVHRNLPPEARETVQRQIGAAPMLAQMVSTGIAEASAARYVYDFPDPTVERSPSIKHEDDELLARWTAELPGVLTINGRPVLRRADMEAFHQHATKANGSPYPPSHVTRVWNGLLRAHRKKLTVSSTDMVARLEYYGAATALEAGIPPDVYTDLYGLYVLARSLKESQKDGYRERSSAFVNVGPECFDFVIEFVEHCTKGIGFEVTNHDTVET